MNINESPLVSVVIPTYNHARYLGRALQSVLNQTYVHWEAIVIDNHSTDNTDEVMVSFADPRITFLKIHNNGVIAASRNMGIRVAKGEWIAFLDSDDWWHKKKLEACILHAGTNFDLIYHDLKVVRKINQRISFRKSRSRKLKKNSYSDLLSNGNAMSNSSVVVRKELLFKINGISEDADKVSWEDFDTWIRLAKTECRFKRIRGSYGNYWVDGNNVSNPNRTLANLKSIANIYLTPEDSVVKNIIVLPWWWYYSSAICYQEINNFESANSHFLLAWQKTYDWHNRRYIIYKWMLMNIIRMKAGLKVS